MNDHYGTLLLILASILTIFGLSNWLHGTRADLALQENPKLKPLPSLNTGYHLFKTAGLGQFILAIVVLFLVADRDFLTRNLPAVGAFYFGFALLRSITMRNVSRKVSAEVGPWFCLAINLFWPVLAVLFIPLRIIDLWDRLDRPTESHSSFVSDYAKES